MKLNLIVLGTWHADLCWKWALLVIMDIFKEKIDSVQMHKLKTQFHKQIHYLKTTY